MKKIILLMIVCLSLVGCQSTTQNSKKKQVSVTTSFLYDMVEKLVKDDVDVELIIPYGEDPHLYNAKPKDLDKIKNADLLLYHGLHFEGKMVEVLEKKGVAITKNFTEDEYTMIDENNNKFVDPHFWFSVKLYKKSLENVREELIKLLPEKAEAITKKVEQYKNELNQLENDIKTQISQIDVKSRYLITPHDAFNYFSKAFNIEVVAPQGVSTDSEVSNHDLESTAKFIVDHKIKAIFSESTTDPVRMRKLQEIVKAKGFNVKVVEGEENELYSDSLAVGQTYVDMMKHNVKLIVDNLK